METNKDVSLSTGNMETNKDVSPSTGNMETNKDVSPSKWYFWRNLLCVSVAALFLTMPYYLFRMFLPSLYPQDSLGTWTSSLSSAIQTPACLFCAAIIIKKMGYKCTLLISSVCIAIFISASFFPSFITLMPGGILFGLGAGIMLTLLNTMIFDLSNGYADVTGSTTTSSSSFFFGVSYAIKESAGIWINICAALLIEPDSEDDIANRYNNVTCGKNYCNEMAHDTFSLSNDSSKTATHSSVLHSDDTLYALCGASMISIVIAIIAALLINVKGKESAKDIDIKSSLLSTFRLMRTTNILLLTPLTISTGIVFSSYSADFSTAFVTCTVGLHYVATVSIAFSTANTCTSALGGTVAKHVKPFYIMMLSVPLTLSALFILLFWTPTPDSLVYFHLMGAFFGLLWAVWQIQLAAVYGATFLEDLESGFSCHRLLQCFGITVGYALSSMLCLQQRIIFSISLFLCGVLAYLGFEVRVRKTKPYTQLEE